MSKPPFVMSKYMNKEDLYREKAEYYLDRSEQLEVTVLELIQVLYDNYVLSSATVGLIQEAQEFIEEDK